MNENLAQIEEHYDRVVTYFINQYKFKANLIRYQEFLIGYSLFEIGINTGCKEGTLDLANFLQNANVQTKNNQELQNLGVLNCQISMTVESLKCGR